MKWFTKLYSLLSHYPTLRNAASLPRLAPLPRCLPAVPRAVDCGFGFASMRNLFPALAVATITLLPASSADAADCLCDRSTSIQTCIETIEARVEAQVEGNDEPRLPPMWCERSDDPRCMPASTHGGALQTLTPLATGWNQQLRWATPPRLGSLLAVSVDGSSRHAHARRVERPPR